MKLVTSILVVSLLVSNGIFAQTQSVNDHIHHWTPKMIEHIKTARDVVDDTDLKQEDILLIEWNAFKHNLSPRKSNPRCFCR